MLEKKIYVLGDEGCGKSSLLYAITGEEAVTDPATHKVYARRSTVVEIASMDKSKKPCFLCCCCCLCCRKRCLKDGQPKLTTKTEKITLIFIEALEEEGRMRAMNYLDTDAVLLCFDVTSYKTLEDLKDKWLPEVNYYCPDEVPIILVGLKGDAVKPTPAKEPLRRRASSMFRVRKMDTTQREAERLVNEENIFAYVQCSSEDGRGLDDLKRTLTSAVTMSVTRSRTASPNVSDNHNNKAYTPDDVTKEEFKKDKEAREITN